ncbi:hypothetical protein B0H16DRAFT_1891185 [Mycena metata]|uniref:MYND-type domain-containing protein n=1 Tax=Mycena metata TaxID=1033252 RepID=A0AAD7IAY2_9AGAR|nr:hypothetical protein B0H16DRAFT_1891185 [Mycena metata]
MTALPLDLQLSQLSLLPPLFRLSAKSAAAGSSKALERIPYLIADCTDLHTPRLVLPALFAVLQRAPVHCVSSQACDNMKCGVILAKSQLRRCSQCGKRYYCSAPCQAKDWRDDGHRGVCKSLQKSSIDLGTATERGFMRAVLDRDFEEDRPALFRRQVMFIYQNPESDFYCLYDYEGVPTGSGVYALENFPCENPFWEDCVARARRSGGRMEIHLMNVPDGTLDDAPRGVLSGRERIFPLRSSRADIQVGLRVIARSLPPGITDVETMKDQIDEKVAALMKPTRDVVQIHCE